MIYKTPESVVRAAVHRVLSNMVGFSSSGDRGYQGKLPPDCVNARLLGVYDGGVVATTIFVFDNGLILQDIDSPMNFVRYREMVRIIEPAKDPSRWHIFHIITDRSDQVAVKVHAGSRTSQAFEWVRFLNQVIRGMRRLGAAL